ncbi:MAG TPA: uracil-DNA glycosylase [Spirochaetota bacterium]|nr:MAG: Uracil DNA glycosylase superfamily protein [Spirochaetes bacterium ADurb.BinA120]HPI15724.1 uracil-DNA glycosylase [Spirochaetota bacterium]
MSEAISDKARLLEELRRHIGDCRRCKLCATRTNIVFGEGDPDARVMFIGEGPGRDEDLQARPFVGRAGQLLTAIIEKGMNIPRADAYIANVVKCRPTIDLKFERDRPPEPDERDACGPFLLRQIEIVRPEVIITLGNPSTQYLLGIRQGITSIRGRWFSHNGIPVMPTYHPSYILRNGGDGSALKKDVWEDVKMVLTRLGGNLGEESGRNAFESLEDSPKRDTDVQGRLF